VFVVEQALAVAAALEAPTSPAIDAGPVSPPDAGSSSGTDAATSPDAGDAIGADGGAPAADGRGDPGCACEASGSHGVPILFLVVIVVLGVWSASGRSFRR
jgi:hypothetical protein